MKIFKSLPANDQEQKDFFNRYANLIPTLFWLGVIAQIISFVTEISVVYNLVSSKLEAFPVPIDPNKILVISWGAAFLLSAFFEVGLRKFVPYSVKAFIYSLNTGLDKVMSFFILAITIFLITGSIIFSYQGSKEMVNVVSVPKKESKEQLENTYAAAVAEIKAQYKSDKSDTEKGYKGQMQAITTKINGLLGKQNNEIDLYKRKQEQRGISYKSRITAHLGNIEIIKSDQGRELAPLQEAQRKDLAQLSENKKQSLKQAKNDYNEKVSRIDSRNKITEARAKSKADMYGGGLAWFTVLCMIVFILSVVVDEVHKKGSGIVEQVLVTQYDFSPSAWSRFLDMVKEKWQSMVHRKITKMEKTTKPYELPVLEHQLFDIGNIEQERVIVEVEKLPDGKYIIPSTLDKSNIVENQANDLPTFSKNLSHESAVFAVMPAPPKVGGANGAKNSDLGNIPPHSPINNLKNKKDIEAARLNIDRSKERYTKKQRGRVEKFYKKYIKQHNKKPSYSVIAVGLELGERAVGDYVRHLKKNNIL